MKKILVIIVAFIASIALSSFDSKAQSRFFDDTFVDAGIGTNIGRGTDGKANYSLGIGTELYVGKWVGRSFGVRAGWHGISTNYATLDVMVDLLKAVSKVENPRLGAILYIPLGVGPNSEGNIAFLTGLGAQLSVKLTDRLSLLFDNKFITPFNPKNTGKIPFFELPKSLPLTIGIRYSFSVPVSASVPAPQEL